MDISSKAATNSAAEDMIRPIPAPILPKARAKPPVTAAAPAISSVILPQFMPFSMTSERASHIKFRPPTASISPAIFVAMPWSCDGSLSDSFHRARPAPINSIASAISLSRSDTPSKKLKSGVMSVAAPPLPPLLSSPLLLES